MTIVFKILFFLRKKLHHIRLIYLRNECIALYPHRVKIDSSVVFDLLPTIDLDQSSSSIILSKGIAIRGNLNLLCHHSGEISIGKNTFFNNGCSINCFENVNIGDNCLFGEAVKIYDHNHRFNNPQQLIKDQGYSTAPIIIGDNVWVGSNVTILKGVSIGSNAIISAGSIINQSIPVNYIVKNSNNLQCEPIIHPSNQ